MIEQPNLDVPFDSWATSSLSLKILMQHLHIGSECCERADGSISLNSLDIIT